ncbi:MAG: SufE family protein [Pseudomonadota bacterium]
MTSFEDIVADFSFLDDWDDRYKYLIDLGRHLPEYPEDRRDDAHKVKGCASQVWLAYDISKSDNPSDPTISLAGDSDAHIVKGLVAVLLSLYSGKTANEIAKLNALDALAPLSLDGHLTPQRTNGLASMAVRIQDIAKAALS